MKYHVYNKKYNFAINLDSKISYPLLWGDLRNGNSRNWKHILSLKESYYVKNTLSYCKYFGSINHSKIKIGIYEKSIS